MLRALSVVALHVKFECMQKIYFLFVICASLAFSQNQQAEHLSGSISVSQTTCMRGDTIWLKYNDYGSDDKEPVKWYSSLNGVIGAGASVAVNDLSVGAHKLWVKTGDLKHHSFHDSITIKPYEPSDDIKRLMQWMTGYFSSEAQADTSTDKYHVDVRLRMRRIWPDSTRSFWIYVEQAYAEDTANPYRQRIYRVFEANGQIRNEIYKITSDSLYLYGWQKPEKFTNLGMKALKFKSCCGMCFKWQPELKKFFAATHGHNCTASIPGVDYITSESEISQNRFTSWDLGYSKEGKVVMGPHSPYIFEKRYNYGIQ